MLQSIANINYLKKCRAQGFLPALLSPKDRDVYQLLADLTEDFTEMDLLSVDESFEKLLNDLIVGMKISLAQNSSNKPKKNGPRS